VISTESRALCSFLICLMNLLLFSKCGSSLQRLFSPGGALSALIVSGVSGFPFPVSLSTLFPFPRCSPQRLLTPVHYRSRKRPPFSPSPLEETPRREDLVFLADVLYHRSVNFFFLFQARQVPGLLFPPDCGGATFFDGAPRCVKFAVYSG